MNHQFYLDPKKEAVKNIERVFPHWKALLADDVYEHSNRVCDLSLMIVNGYGFDLNMAIEIAMGALLHDVGKSQVNQDILAKVEKLNEDDRLIIECHPQLGHQLLRKLPFPKAVIDIAHYHHEKLDGSGYPDALDARKIDIRTQIVTVADMYEAITADRVYHKPLSKKDALDILRGENEKKVNQTCVELIARLV